MELEEFKNLFNKQSSSLPTESAAEIGKMIHKRGQTAIGKVLRNMMLELAFAVVAAGASLVFALLYKGATSFKWFAAIMIVVLVLQTLLFIPVYRKIKKLRDQQSDALKIWLKSLVDAVETFLNFYKRSMLISMPIAMLVGGYIGYTIADEPNDPMVPYFEMAFIPVWARLALILGVLVGVYYYLKWVLHYLYGRYLNQMKAGLKELEG